MSHGIHLIAIMSEKKKLKSKWEIINLFSIDEKCNKIVKAKCNNFNAKSYQLSNAEFNNPNSKFKMTRLSIQSVALNKMTGES